MKRCVLLSTAGLLILGFVIFDARQRLASARRDLMSAQERVATLERKAVEASLRKVEVNSSAADTLELMRLRAEVTALRREGATLKQMAEVRSAENKQGETPRTLAGDEMLKYLTRTNNFVSHHDQEVIAALNQKHRELREWWKALQQYAEANEGRLPTELGEAHEFLPHGFTKKLNLSNFVRPSPDALPAHLPSIENPAMTVLFKEREPLVLGDGTVCNMHLFADGKVIMFKD